MRTQYFGMHTPLISAHASQAFSIVHCTDSEDLPLSVRKLESRGRRGVRILTRSSETVSFCASIVQMWESLVAMCNCLITEDKIVAHFN